MVDTASKKWNHLVEWIITWGDEIEKSFFNQRSSDGSIDLNNLVLRVINMLNLISNIYCFYEKKFSSKKVFTL